MESRGHYCALIEVYHEMIVVSVLLGYFFYLHLGVSVEKANSWVDLGLGFCKTEI